MLKGQLFKVITSTLMALIVFTKVTVAIAVRHNVFI